MRLPGIRYERPVQRFGRQDIMAPQRIASIQARTASIQGRGLAALAQGLGDLGQSIKEIERQQAVEQYNNAMAIAEIGMIKAEAEVNAGPELSTESFPEIGQIGFDFSQTVMKADGSGTETVETTTAPTWEVGVPAFSKRMDNIRSTAMASITNSRARQKFANEFAIMQARAEAKQAAVAAKQRQEYNVARVTFAIDEFTRVGNEAKAKAAIKQAVASRMITAADGIGLWQGVEQSIDQNAALNIIATGSDTQLEALRRSIGSQARMPFEQKKQLLSMTMSEVKRRDAAARKAAGAARDASAVNWTQRVLSGESSVRELLANGHTMTESTLARLVRLQESMDEARDEQASRVSFEEHTQDVESLAYTTGELEDRAEQRRFMRERILDDPDLTTEQRTRLLDRLDNVQETVYDSPAYDHVNEQMHLLIVGASRGQVNAANTSAEARAVLARAKSDLHRSLKTNPNLDPDDWWEARRGRYMNERVLRRLNAAEFGPEAKKHIKREPGTSNVDVEASRQSIMSKIRDEEKALIEADRRDREDDVEASMRRAPTVELRIKKLRKALRVIDELGSQ